jgi:hypothetical protein
MKFGSQDMVEVQLFHFGSADRDKYRRHAILTEHALDEDGLTGADVSGKDHAPIPLENPFPQGFEDAPMLVTQPQEFRIGSHPEWFSLKVEMIKVHREPQLLPGAFHAARSISGGLADKRFWLCGRYGRPHQPGSCRIFLTCVSFYTKLRKNAP